MMSPELFRVNAIKLMNEFNVGDWGFEFDRAKKRIGCCSYSKKTLSFSMYFVSKLEWSELENTVRHEIAHALCSFEDGHNYRWKMMAIKCGARPERCSSVNVEHNFKWILPCRCEKKPGFHRSPKYINREYRCKKCCYKGVLIKNGNQVNVYEESGDLL